MLSYLKPPSTPAEAIIGRREKSFAFGINIYLQEHTKLMAFLTKTRDAILEIVDPGRAEKQKPIRDPNCIKVKRFHAAVFGTEPLLDVKEFADNYAHENGPLNDKALDAMCDVLKEHLASKKPSLAPLGCELMNKDGTILARFSYQSDGDNKALSTLRQELDPEQKLSTWDANNPARKTTVTVVLCVLNTEQMPDKLTAINELIEKSSEDLKNIGTIQINQFQLINAYDKRTLSLKHIAIYADVTAKEIIKSSFKINPIPLTIVNRVISDLTATSRFYPQDISQAALTLKRQYSFAESVGSEQLQFDDADIVVVLSGRSGFNGDYTEEADKHVLCEDSFDKQDTVRRMQYGIAMAKRCNENNEKHGLTKQVYVYFNGVKKQNDELKAILEKDGFYDGYPKDLFIIDSIPLDNTLGQVIALNKYLDEHWPRLSQKWRVTRGPNLVLCTSTYHLIRAIRAFGANSPLLTREYWTSNPLQWSKLSQEMQDYVLKSSVNTLKQANLLPVGCDREIHRNSFWEKDLIGDTQAVVNYSSNVRSEIFNVSSSPSIANVVADNVRPYGFKTGRGFFDRELTDETVQNEKLKLSYPH